MTRPALLTYSTVADYKKHYERVYQRGNICTADGIRVYFRPQKFGHAFYMNSQGKVGAKDTFSQERAERMDWIKATLESPEASLFMGWNKDDKCYEEDRRVSVVFDDFVVVIEMSLTSKGELKANFITCYVADNSIGKIQSTPAWDLEKCLSKLRK